jgi:hypothetical protein
MRSRFLLRLSDQQRNAARLNLSSQSVLLKQLSVVRGGVVRPVISKLWILAQKQQFSNLPFFLSLYWLEHVHTQVYIHVGEYMCICAHIQDVYNT